MFDVFVRRPNNITSEIFENRKELFFCYYLKFSKNLIMYRLVILDLMEYGRNLIFDDEENYENEVVNKIWDFAEDTIPRFRDHQFKQHFRMNPATFENLLMKVHNAEFHTVQSGHPQLTLEKQVMITVWCLANVESFRQVSLKFGIAQSTCWDVLYRVCRKLLVVNQQHGIIAWPRGERAREIMNGFQEMSQFPGVIGAIDGCHIRITKPKTHPNSYVNRKGYHSVLLQGTCDNKKIFTHVFTGVAGSVHDYRLYQMSDLSYQINNNLVHFPNNSHLVGDLAYVISESLLVGFKNNGNLTNHQKNFNLHLSKARVVIENAFAWLKGRFRRLKMLETVREDLICLLIVAACILHNMCIMDGDEPLDIVLPALNEAEERDYPGIVGNADGRAKRNNIMYMLQ